MWWTLDNQDKFREKNRWLIHPRAKKKEKPNTVYRNANTKVKHLVKKLKQKSWEDFGHKLLRHDYGENQTTTDYRLLVTETEDSK